MSFEESSVD